MPDWKPLSEDRLGAMIEEAELDMGRGCKRFWDYIKITPRKWRLSPWGDEGGGFWVVAVIGGICLYYNDIEDGFNRSPYKLFGHIDEYQCAQPDLLSAVCNLYWEFLEKITVDG